ncbi:hypothetical protein EK21DRAFT_116527 [Setomelanomma holmii]|uniref:Transcription factor domain-containing protein n=1 Tax=Setomelanomma holmii TaxID=210430 RepID=A0A9P4LHR0_9PLEO|nr:hypothetical protein EK21DRAFT_116527 [Setomelanomma holmii]
MPSYDLRSFTRRPGIKGGAQMTAALIVRIVTSYPGMMRDPASLPPFIHQASLLEVPGCGMQSMESLNTCASLMQLLGSGTPGSRKLVWKNVRLECERFYTDWMILDEWELLSSMQALLIYILLRLQEGEHTFNNFDVLLLSAMWVIACALNLKIGNLECSSPTGLSYGTTYEEWVFEESRRRLAMTFRTIGMLVSTEPAGGCTLFDDFLLAPLPARKQLWEARSETQWMLEKHRNPSSDGVFGIKMDGTMVRLNGYSKSQSDHEPLAMHSQASSDTANSVNWQEWCSGMDGLGSLVMLAASLPV